MKPPFCSVVIIPENNSAPDPLVSTHVVVLAEMPPMTESSTLAHPVTDRGLANSNNTLVVGSGGGRGLDVTGGSSSVVTEVSVDGVERDSELQELRRNMHTSESVVARTHFRISILAAFARPAERLVGLTLCFAFGNRLTTVTLCATAGETEFDLCSTA